MQAPGPSRRSFLAIGLAAVVSPAIPFKPVKSAQVFVGMDTAFTPDLTILHEFMWDNSTGKWWLVTKTETTPIKEDT
ncbi:hypothetical protein PhaeoP24_01205 [Phaeobacter inhibens]|uniref:hypothetical protein n=1 Tax=Phaeobacter inhibens TaxID=221822 RepID=UPI000C9AB6AB|nr:hypothetical protein [Phaeobacter inhibens]AUQ89833.1 hypothetical protein PhaeoP24_01205 [Phaeobacter inhibens]